MCWRDPSPRGRPREPLLDAVRQIQTLGARRPFPKRSCMCILGSGFPRCRLTAPSLPHPRVLGTVIKESGKGSSPKTPPSVFTDLVRSPASGCSAFKELATLRGLSSTVPGAARSRPAGSACPGPTPLSGLKPAVRRWSRRDRRAPACLVPFALKVHTHAPAPTRPLLSAWQLSPCGHA